MHPENKIRVLFFLKEGHSENKMSSWKLKNDSRNFKFSRLEDKVEAMSQEVEEKGRVGKQEKIKELTKENQHSTSKFPERVNKVPSTKI